MDNMDKIKEPIEKVLSDEAIVKAYVYIVDMADEICDCMPCDECPFSARNNGKGLHCSNFKKEYPKEFAMVAISYGMPPTWGKYAKNRADDRIPLDIWKKLKGLEDNDK